MAGGEISIDILVDVLQMAHRRLNPYDYTPVGDLVDSLEDLGIEPLIAKRALDTLHNYGLADKKGEGKDATYIRKG